MSNSSTAIPAQNAPAPVQALDQDEREQLALIHTLVGTVYHFFGGFAQLFRPIHDPRVPYLITYPLDSMCFAGVSMFLCRLGARRQINHMFRGNGPSEAKFQALFGVETCPHGDTLNVLYSRLDPSELQEVPCWMVETLIRKKVLYRHRLLDRYFLIAIDGTGMLTFPE